MPFSAADKAKQQRKLQNRIAAFSGCFGSNAKWRKIFETLLVHADPALKCFVKDIWNTSLLELKIPERAEYSRIFSATGFKDSAHSVPYEFKEIAYLYFPATWTHNRKMRREVLQPFVYKQDLDHIEGILAAAGGMETDRTEEGLWVWGYKK